MVVEVRIQADQLVGPGRDDLGGRWMVGMRVMEARDVEGNHGEEGLRVWVPLLPQESWALGLIGVEK